ncbi:tomosyn isoform c [Anaeramoeba ignava]|uniref:Tomosyn isoform c n=1 Tax=Anaeramoeba ignava TaxID=1746090 RepID=A0A9Q0R406_ANAIG|nr:tomosyn isoform c [Anaeramoeba ignava]
MKQFSKIQIIQSTQKKDDLISFSGFFSSPWLNEIQTPDALILLYKSGKTTFYIENSSKNQNISFMEIPYHFRGKISPILAMKVYYQISETFLVSLSLSWMGSRNKNESFWPFNGGDFSNHYESKPSTVIITAHQDSFIRFWDASTFALLFICECDILKYLEEKNIPKPLDSTIFDFIFEPNSEHLFVSFKKEKKEDKKEDKKGDKPNSPRRKPLVLQKEEKNWKKENPKKEESKKEENQNQNPKKENEKENPKQEESKKENKKEENQNEKAEKSNYYITQLFKIHKTNLNQMKVLVVDENQLLITSDISGNVCVVSISKESPVIHFKNYGENKISFIQLFQVPIGKKKEIKQVNIAFIGFENGKIQLLDVSSGELIDLNVLNKLNINQKIIKVFLLNEFGSEIEKIEIIKDVKIPEIPAYYYLICFEKTIFLINSKLENVGKIEFEEIITQASILNISGNLKQNQKQNLDELLNQNNPNQNIKNGLILFTYSEKNHLIQNIKMISLLKLDEVFSINLKQSLEIPQKAFNDSLFDFLKDGRIFWVTKSSEFGQSSLLKNENYLSIPESLPSLYSTSIQVKQPKKLPNSTLKSKNKKVTLTEFYKSFGEKQYTQKKPQKEETFSSSLFQNDSTLKPIDDKIDGNDALGQISQARDKLLERGEKIENLEIRSNQLTNNSSEFLSNIRQLTQKKKGFF